MDHRGRLSRLIPVEELLITYWERNHGPFCSFPGPCTDALTLEQPGLEPVCSFSTTNVTNSLQFAVSIREVTDSGDQWVTLSFRNTKVLHQSVTPNNRFNT